MSAPGEAPLRRGQSVRIVDPPAPEREALKSPTSETGLSNFQRTQSIGDLARKASFAPMAEATDPTSAKYFAHRFKEDAETHYCDAWLAQTAVADDEVKEVCDEITQYATACNKARRGDDDDAVPKAEHSSVAADVDPFAHNGALQSILERPDSGSLWNDRKAAVKAFSVHTMRRAAGVLNGHMRFAAALEAFGFRRIAPTASSYVAIKEGLFFHAWRSTSEARRFLETFRRLHQAIFEHGVPMIHAPVSAAVQVRGFIGTLTQLVPLEPDADPFVPAAAAHPCLHASHELLTAALRHYPDAEAAAERSSLRVPPIALHRATDGRFYVVGPDGVLPHQVGSGDHEGEVCSYARHEALPIIASSLRAQGKVVRLPEGNPQAMTALVVEHCIPRALEALHQAFVAGGDVGGLVRGHGLSSLFHEHGVNLRFLYKALRVYVETKEGDQCFAEVCEALMAEMALRTLKDLLRADLRTSKDDTEDMACDRVNRMMHNCMQQRKSRIWDDHVMPALRRKYGAPMDFVVPVSPTLIKFATARWQRSYGFQFDKAKFRYTKVGQVALPLLYFSVPNPVRRAILGDARGEADTAASMEAAAEASMSVSVRTDAPPGEEDEAASTARKKAAGTDLIALVEARLGPELQGDGHADTAGDIADLLFVARMCLLLEHDEGTCRVIKTLWARVKGLPAGAGLRTVSAGVIADLDRRRRTAGELLEPHIAAAFQLRAVHPDDAWYQAIRYRSMVTSDTDALPRLVHASRVAEGWASLKPYDWHFELLAEFCKGLNPIADSTSTCDTAWRILYSADHGDVAMRQPLVLGGLRRITTALVQGQDQKSCRTLREIADRSVKFHERCFTLDDPRTGVALAQAVFISACSVWADLEYEEVREAKRFHTMIVALGSSTVQKITDTLKNSAYLNALGKMTQILSKYRLDAASVTAMKFGVLNAERNPKKIVAVEAAKATVLDRATERLREMLQDHLNVALRLTRQAQRDEYHRRVGIQCTWEMLFNRLALQELCHYESVERRTMRRLEQHVRDRIYDAHWRERYELRRLERLQEREEEWELKKKTALREAREAAAHVKRREDERRAKAERENTERITEEEKAALQAELHKRVEEQRAKEEQEKEEKRRREEEAEQVRDEKLREVQAARKAKQQEARRQKLALFEEEAQAEAKRALARADADLRRCKVQGLGLADELRLEEAQVWTDAFAAFEKRLAFLTRAHERALAKKAEEEEAERKQAAMVEQRRKQQEAAATKQREHAEKEARAAAHRELLRLAKLLETEHSAGCVPVVRQEALERKALVDRFRQAAVEQRAKEDHRRRTEKAEADKAQRAEEATATDRERQEKLQRLAALREEKARAERAELDRRKTVDRVVNATHSVQRGAEEAAERTGREETVARTALFKAFKAEGKALRLRLADERRAAAARSDEEKRQRALWDQQLTEQRRDAGNQQTAARAKVAAEEQRARALLDRAADKLQDQLFGPAVAMTRRQLRDQRATEAAKQQEAEEERRRIVAEAAARRKEQEQLELERHRATQQHIAEQRQLVAAATQQHGTITEQEFAARRDFTSQFFAGARLLARKEESQRRRHAGERRTETVANRIEAEQRAGVQREAEKGSALLQRQEEKARKALVAAALQAEKAAVRVALERERRADPGRAQQPRIVSLQELREFLDDDGAFDFAQSMRGSTILSPVQRATEAIPLTDSESDDDFEVPSTALALQRLDKKMQERAKQIVADEVARNALGTTDAQAAALQVHTSPQGPAKRALPPSKTPEPNRSLSYAHPHEPEPPATEPRRRASAVLPREARGVAKVKRVLSPRQHQALADEEALVDLHRHTLAANSAIDKANFDVAAQRLSDAVTASRMLLGKTRQIAHAKMQVAAVNARFCVLRGDNHLAAANFEKVLGAERKLHGAPSPRTLLMWARCLALSGEGSRAASAAGTAVALLRRGPADLAACATTYLALCYAKAGDHSLSRAEFEKAYHSLRDQFGETAQATLAARARMENPKAEFPELPPTASAVSTPET